MLYFDLQRRVEKENWKRRRRGSKRRNTETPNRKSSRAQHSETLGRALDDDSTFGYSPHTRKNSRRGAHCLTIDVHYSYSGDWDRKDTLHWNHAPR
jgi:hypothetical protein